MAAAVATFCAAPAANAGNIYLTGHDLDFHCSGGEQCNAFGIALDFARQGAPDKTLPILVLDKGLLEVQQAAAMAASKARNTVQGAGNAFPLTVVDPSSAAFASLALSVTNFSAIVIASDTTCGGCDLNGFGITPDSDAINARSADITNFFNAGGGLVFLAGAENRAVYYQSVPIPATAVAVSAPFTVTAEGAALGLTNNDANCCPTHNSFSLPPAGSPLKVAETDSAGNAETLFAGNVSIGDGGFEGGSGVPEPGTVLSLSTGLGLIALHVRRRRARSRGV